MRVLLTGGTGYIGSAVLDSLVRAGHHVDALVRNREKAAEYIKNLTYNQQIWKDSIAGTDVAHPGQLPPYKSIYAEWDATPPDWMPPFVGLVREQLERARAITNHKFGLSQFQIGKGIWEKYLTGEVTDPAVVMQEVMDAVTAEEAKG